MSTPSPIDQEHIPLHGRVQGHALKRELPSALGDDPAAWVTLEDEEARIETAPLTSYLVYDADPKGGDRHVLVVFEACGEMAGPLRYRVAAEHSASKLLRAARSRQRIRTLAALVVTLAWCGGTQVLAIRWMLSESYAWIVAGLLLGMLAVEQLRLGGKAMLKGVVELFRTRLPAQRPLHVTMPAAGDADQDQVA